ncbi:type II toxin-antitoxin system VapC family toxin [Nocardioides carbamazepini]|uniref:type II toxin-antitoxin system VapC family toxin n=1 Tax=Nocardioides carbamazepini TaxID=2854259 RepID=UPI0021499F71|nr:type II toxin-antitoxin system VapC family toxin [Nocardioides carbamazepini]MCR1782780.1 type II toxin-antitoxin system VapC family toxin [Nocardioides carbamazepini]
MILFDTAPIVAAAFTTEDHHHACVELFAGLRLAERALLLPTTVAAEVGYLIDRLGGPVREAGFLAGIAEGGFEPVELTLTDYARMAELVEQYADLRLGTTDASIIALAERLGITEIATLDRRHFTAVRPRHVDALTLLPEQL